VPGRLAHRFGVGRVFLEPSSQVEL
jgi:hypothetical protein